jgi:hypothetical protein
MKAVAIQLAGERLERAKAAFVTMSDENCTLGEFRAAWSTFIAAANTVYSKLEQGSKGSGKSSACFGRQKHVRTMDPLLSYILHARNSDEHGLEIVSGVGVFAQSLHEGVDVRADAKGLHLNFDLEEPTFIPPGTPMAQLKFGFYPRSVKDRGVQYDPPEQRLDRRVEDSTGVGIAALAIAYLEKMLTEAKAYSAG